jgi:DNA-binding GntR family transcriptional regulator
MANSIITYQPLDYTDLTEQVYRILKDKILRRELEPGEQIAVPEVAFALGVSRTPITDALKRLASEGLVKIAPR